MRLHHRVTLLLATGTALAAMALADPNEADAKPLCEVRSSAHIAEHGGRLEDDRYHIARGELPNCDAAETSTRPTPVPKNDENDDDDKGRYCRKHFFC